MSILNGHDTLALLPTGGGKSVCFQVPALAREGICLVITPLIALMKDQVSQLRNRGIQAVAIHAGMNRSEIDILLDNCIYGVVKFLYVSPERIQTELFIARVKQMNVNLIAVDEAHCISQWGYDFRPPYLKIADLRELKPGVPVIALTATATPAVRDDVMEKLMFRKPHGLFQKSFARTNLSFVVRNAENKERKLLDILQKVKGSAIVYVRSRKATQEVATALVKRGIRASYYHAGLSFEERSKRQEEWIQNHTRVMVATNAFGMGIDKPDVRTVVHLDLPENMEAYYQEAGRAGRDGLKSYAAILYQQADIANLQLKTELAHPSPEFLRKIYQALANYFQLAEGSSEGESYDFDLHDFAERFHFQSQEIYVALKKLEEEGLIQFNESFYSPSQVYLLKDKPGLYQFQIANARFDPFIKMILRLYGGELFSGYSKISEQQLAKGLKLPYDETVLLLKHLHELRVLDYQPVRDKPQLTFVLPRQDTDRLPLNIKRLEARKQLSQRKMNTMIEFVTSSHRCRMVMIQEYFGELDQQDCGMCDVCIGRKKKENFSELRELQESIVTLVSQRLITVEELEERIAPRDHELFVDVVRDMVDDGVLEYDDAWQLKVIKKNN